MRDHRVHGVRILPGVTFLDLILRMARTCGLDPAQVALRRILFTKPIALEEGQERWVRLLLEPKSDGAQVHVLSARRGESDETRMDWEENARAELVVERSPIPPDAVVPSVPEPGGNWQELDRAYERARATGIRHQDFMKSQGRFLLTPQGVWAELTLAESAQARASDFWLHPALLDAATVVAALPLAGSAAAAEGDAFIPFVIDQFRAVVSISPSYTSAIFELGMALYRKGEMTAAAEEFRKALESSPRYAPAAFMLGEALRKEGEFGEAIQAYRESLKLNPKDAEAYVHIAECNLQLDLLDGARKAIDQALAVNSRHREALYLKKHLGEMKTPHKPGF